MPKVFKLNQSVVHYAVRAGNDKYVVSREGSALLKISQDATLYTQKRFAEALMDRAKGKMSGDFEVVEVIVSAYPTIESKPKSKARKTEILSLPVEPRDVMIAKTAIKIVSEQLGLPEDSVKIDHNIRDDLGGDSLDIIEIVIELEDTLEVEFPDSVIEKLRTVKDVADHIRGYPRAIL